MVHIVNAASKHEAEKLALNAGAWDGCDVHELDTKTPGVVFDLG